MAGFFSTAGNASLAQQMENVDLAEDADKGKVSRCCLKSCGPKTWNQVKSHRQIVTACVVDVMSAQQIWSLCSDFDDQIGVRGVDVRGRPLPSSVTSRKWCGQRDVCR